ncbi:T9SS type A sorting domain-containing protein, partial [Bacteroidota bacterium]
QINSLISKLENALASQEKGNYKTAVNQLGAFINQVEASINSGRLTEEDGNKLIDAANNVIATINNTEKSLAENEINTVIPSEFVLSQNYPNPFNPSTIIRYSLPEAIHVKLEIFNPIGQLISTLDNNYMEAGFHETTFNADDLPSGVYVYRLTTGKFISSTKMILLR